MNDLIEALTIFAKYQKETQWPTHCEHDVLMVMGVAEDALSPEDAERVSKLGFHWMSDGYWGSFRFGSA